jgi:hypothetical protein
MVQEKSQLEILDAPRASCCNLTYLVAGLLGGIALSLMLGMAFWFGRMSTPGDIGTDLWNGISRQSVPPDLLSATATHGGSNLAVCTALVGDDAEGFFALDFLTGELKAWVYYPKQGAFGGTFMTNVTPQLGQSKNPEYLLVSGQTAAARLGGNVKLAQSLIYVVDTRSGYFAAYTAPWNSSLESSAGAPQSAQMIFVSGGQIRESNAGAKKPTNPMPNGANPAANPGGAIPANPANPADPKPANPNIKKPK